MMRLGGPERRGGGAADAVWVVALQQSDSVARLDSDSGQVVGGPVSVGNGPTSAAANGATVWVTNLFDDTVFRIDAGAARAKPARTGERPLAVAAGEGSIWVLNSARPERRADGCRGSGEGALDVTATDPDPRVRPTRLRGTGRRRRHRLGHRRGGQDSGPGSTPRERTSPSASRSRSAWAQPASPSATASPGSRTSATAGSPDRFSVRGRFSASQVPPSAASPWRSQSATGPYAVIDQSGKLLRARPRVRRACRRARISLGGRPAALAVGDGAVWVADPVARSVTRVTP